MPVILKNNAFSTLATAITASDTAIVVVDGSQFPALSAGEYFYTTLVSPAGTTEIVKVTARVSNSLTVVRAQDGSSAASFQVGTLVEMRTNAASVQDAVTQTLTQLSAAFSAAVADQRAVRDVAGLRADTTFTYTPGTDDTVAAGDIIRTQAEGFAYQVAASDATDHHLITAGGVKLYVAPANQTSVAAFGAVGDGVTDNAAAFTAVSEYITNTSPGTLYIPEGVYNTSVAISNTRGVNVIGQGQVTLVPVGSDRVYKLGGSRGMPLPTATINAGNTVITFDSDPGVVAGDTVFIRSAASLNSTPGNFIPRYKDWLKVQSVSGNTVTFATPARYTQDPTDDMVVSQILCIGGVTENITIATTAPPFTGPYPWHVVGAYQHTFRNMKCTNSASFVVNSDLIQFENCEIQGFNSGASTATGAGRVSYRDCILRTGPVQPNGAAQFAEETPDRVYMENCDFFGTLVGTSSTDTTPPKQLIIRGGRIFAPGVAVRQTGFYNSDGYALDMEGVTIYAPGGNTSTYTGPDTVIAIAFANSTRVFNCTFVGVDPANYLVAASSIGTYRLMWHGNRATSGLGIHSSLAAALIQAPHVFAGPVATPQVAFPAVPTPSTNPNTLDDFEEGTFTPNLACETVDFGAKTVSGAGVYTKIGRVVTFTIYLRTDAIALGSASGNLVVTGLPFAARSDVAPNSRPRGERAIAVSRSAGFNGTNTNAVVAGHINGGASVVNLLKMPTAGSPLVFMTAADTASHSGVRVIVLSGSYET
jgi:hypothetical protein